MNRYARDVVIGFSSRRNYEYLHARLSSKFARSSQGKVNKFLCDHLITHMQHFAAEISRELMISDLLPGVTIMQQIIGFNEQFLADEIDFILKHVIGDDMNPAANPALPTLYSVSDGMPTSRYGAEHHAKNSNDILAVWNMAPARQVQSREDTASDIGAATNQFYWGSRPNCERGVDTSAFIVATKVSTAGMTAREIDAKIVQKFYGLGLNPRELAQRVQDEKIRVARQGFIEYLPTIPTHGSIESMSGGMQSMQSSPVHTGITFCDQSHLGTSNHLEQYEDTDYKLRLNSMRDPYARTAFGVDTEAAAQRLLDRNVFRNGNRIPNYEARLQRRHGLDRDVSEGLRNAERGCMVHGYDMSSLRNRLDYKDEVAKKHAPTRVNMDLSHNYQNYGDPGTTYY